MPHTHSEADCVLAAPLALVRWRCATVGVAGARAAAGARSYGMPPTPPGATAPPAESVAGAGAEFAATETVAEVRIVGNETTSTTQIASHLTTRAGRPFDASVVQRDVRKLASLGWFVDVKSLYETTPQGRIVIFQVVERPTIRYVDYLGNKNDPRQDARQANAAQSRRLGRPLRGRGRPPQDPRLLRQPRFNNVQITILEGNKATDQGVVYLIHEGTSAEDLGRQLRRQRVRQRRVLKTKIKSKPPILMIWKGYVDREKIDADKDLLTAYYRSFGFFQARISRTRIQRRRQLDDDHVGHPRRPAVPGARRQVHGRHEVRDRRDGRADQAQGRRSRSSRPRCRTTPSGCRTCTAATALCLPTSSPKTVFLEEPGQVDLLYHIEEGQKWRVGRIFVHIGGDNPHTRIQTALNRVTLRPGQIMDIRELKASERRLAASSVFNVDQATGKRPKITFQHSRGRGSRSGRAAQREDSRAEPGRDRARRRHRAAER